LVVRRLNLLIWQMEMRWPIQHEIWFVPLARISIWWTNSWHTRVGHETLHANPRSKRVEQFARTKVKKEKQKNIKAIHKTMNTTNMLQMVQLFQSLGYKGKAREILQSVHNGMNKFDASSEVDDNESDKENMTMTSNITITSNESNKANMATSMTSNTALYCDSDGNNLHEE
jgi:asparagine N-glycosylation enzyme membrane subunit Stt3